MKNLDTKLEKILNKYWMDELGLADGSEYPLITQLKSLIKSTLLDALPKEIHSEADPRYYEHGWNDCLKDIKDTLEGI